MAIISQGYFTQPATATNINLPIASDVDWMYVYNQTQIAAGSASTGYQFYWQRGLPSNAGFEWQSNAGSTAVNLVYITSGGFNLINTTINTPGVLNNGSTGISAISTATPPVVTVGSTTGIAAGSIVRLYNTTGATQFGGYDFTVGNGTLTGTTFSLDYAPTLGAAGTGGSFRAIPYNPYFYPRNQYITSITQANPCVVKTSVTHGYQVGMSVAFRIPSIFGMTQLDTLFGTIVAVNTATNTFSVNIDTSAFSAFTFPLTGTQPFTPAQVFPNGMDTAYAANNSLNQLSDAYVNVGYIGMQLRAGVNSPAGQAGDTIYWVAGKSDTTNNIIPAPLYL